MTNKEIENKITKLSKENEVRIFLLSIEEYEKYKNEIPLIKDWWWLRSPGFDRSRAAGVGDDGSVYYLGSDVDYDGDCVRPALRYENLIISKSEKGEEYFMYNEVRWKIIDKENQIAISEMPIGYQKFDNKSNDYKNSYIRQWLLDWVDKQC